MDIYTGMDIQLTHTAPVQRPLSIAIQFNQSFMPQDRVQFWGIKMVSLVQVHPLGQLTVFGTQGIQHDIHTKPCFQTSISITEEL